MTSDDRIEDIESEDTLTDNLKLLNKENISNVLGMYSKITGVDHRGHQRESTEAPF